MTTVLGLAAGSPLVVEGLMAKDFWKAFVGLAICAMGAVAKDLNQTGKSGLMGGPGDQKRGNE
jgi:hypothetical protein